jgi:E3 SUMO-protein ligase PIAS1
VFLASKVAMTHLTGLIKNGRMISKNQVLAESEFLHGRGRLTATVRSRQDDDDIVATSSIMSLKDPVSQMRIKMPCRGYNCSHMQCFDAETYLQMQEQAPLWACPICNKPTPFEDVAVDQ